MQALGCSQAGVRNGARDKISFTASPYAKTQLAEGFSIHDYQAIPAAFDRERQPQGYTL